MRIFLIARGYPSKQESQWGCFEKDQAEALAKVGHEVVMLSYDGRFRRYWRPLGMHRIQAKGIVAYDCFYAPTMFVGIFSKKLARRFCEWQIDKVYRAAVKEFGQPDILYSHYLKRTHLALYLRDKYGVPLVGIEHWSDIARQTLPLSIKKMGSETYPRLDGLIAVSPALQKRIQSHFGVDSTVVFNLVGSEFHYTPSVNLSTCVHYIYVGSLIHRKRIDLILNAFAAANLPADAWDFIVVGSGPLRKDLQAQAEQLGLTKNVRFLGSKTKDEIVQLYQQSDVMLLASERETFSVVCVEALACGLPVIATICGGPESFVRKEDGLLCPVNDVNAFSNALKQMQQDHSKYDRKQIAADCQARFSPEVIARQLTQVFEDVLAKNKAKK